VNAKSAPHIPWAFSLERAPHLPLTGEAHPLNRETGKWLYWGSGGALMVGLLLFGMWTAWSRAEKREPVVRQVKIVRYTELGVPPSLSRQVKPVVPHVEIAAAVAPPKIGVPEPVPDEMAPTPTIATQSEMKEALEPVTVSDLGGAVGETLVVQDDVERSPAPDEFVAVEEQPVRIRIDPPVYPDMARQAGVEGTVLVRALVGKDGKVKDCLILDGQTMLRDAAIACAKTAFFRPALTHQQPVEVWVIIPVTFKLN
jgi:protein TonB